ncbi:MAG TPA: hypothetical protein VKT53_12490 [Candidatus Acidoferrum sp.]|nr:hypothetical protein [Candidatus Acidoferrum sp.]
MKSLRHPAQQQEILRRVHLIQPSTERLWGSMSSHQMICHLSDGFRLYMGEKKAQTVASPMPKWLMATIAIYMPFPWPHGVKTMRELDQQAGGGTPPEEFTRDQSELRSLIDRFINLPRDFAWPEHPSLGKFSYNGWMRLAYRHCDHHLRQFGG